MAALCQLLLRLRDAASAVLIVACHVRVWPENRICLIERRFSLYAEKMSFCHFETP